jgi:hypothetical protein
MTQGVVVMYMQQLSTEATNINIDLWFQSISLNVGSHFDDLISDFAHRILAHGQNMDVTVVWQVIPPHEMWETATLLLGIRDRGISVESAETVFATMAITASTYNLRVVHVVEQGVARR